MGRVDISGLDPAVPRQPARLSNRENGEGKAARVIAVLRATGSVAEII